MFNKTLARNRVWVLILGAIGFSSSNGLAENAPIAILKHVDATTAVISPDGKTLASAAPDKSTLKLWDLTTMRERVTIQHSCVRPRLEFSPNSQTLALRDSAREEKRPFGFPQRIGSNIQLFDVIDGNLLTTLDHSRIESVSFVGNGKTVATHGEGVTKLWDATTGKQLHTIAEDNFALLPLFFTPDGSVFATFTYDKNQTANPWPATSKVHMAKASVRLWNVSDGRERFTLPMQFCHNVLCSSDSRTMIVVRSPNTTSSTRATNDALPVTAAVFDIVESKLRTEFELGDARKQSIREVLLTADGRSLITVEPAQITLWSVDTGKRIASHPVKDGNVRKFNPDGRMLLIGAAVISSGELAMWNVESGTRTSSIRTAELIEYVAVTPDGRRAVVAGSKDFLEDRGHVRIFDLTSSVERASFATVGHVKSLAISPNGKHLCVSIKSQDYSGYVKLYDLEGQIETDLFEVSESPITNIAFSPDSEYLALGTWDDLSDEPSDIVVISRSTGQETAIFRGRRDFIAGAAEYLGQVVDPFNRRTARFTSVALSPNGKTLASFSSSVVDLWDLATKAPAASFPRAEDNVSSLIFGADGKFLVMPQLPPIRPTDEPGPSQKRTTLRGYQGLITSAAFSSNGKHFVSIAHVEGNSGRRGELKIWDWANARELHHIASMQPIDSIAFLPDGKTLVAAGMAPPQSEFNLYDLATGKPRRTILDVQDRTMEQEIFSPDSKYLAGIDIHADNLIRVWDTTENGPPVTFEAPGDVLSLDFAPDGKTLLTVQKGTITLWNVSNPR